MEIYSGRPSGEEGRKEVEIACYDLLESLGVEFSTACHEAAFTMEACREVEGALGAPIFKNLFLCNRQQTEFYLLLLPGNKVFKTKYLSAPLGCARLSFAGAEFMIALLGIQPGAVSPMGLMNDTGHRVRLVVDNDLLAYDMVGCHPCVNTSTLRLSLDDLLHKVVPATGHAVTFVELPGE